MKNGKPVSNIFTPFRRLRWRLTLSFTLVTLAALLMVLWWSFIGISLYLNSTTPRAELPAARAELVNTLLPIAVPAALILILPAVAVAAVFGFMTARWLEIRLNRLRNAANAWGEGKFSVRIRDDGQDEITSFGKQLNQMAVELETLMQTRQELAAVEERNQLARDLHDSVKQQLAAAALQIGAAQSLGQRDPTAAQQSLAQAEQLARQAQTELTNIILELRPAALHAKGLPDALKVYIDQWSQQSGITAEYASSDVPALPFTTELVLFRIAQEALANIARHSQANHAKVQLSTEGGTLELCIEDNGSGFDPALINSPGFGLTSMTDRMQSAGGNLQVNSLPGQGTRVVAQLPLSPRATLQAN